MQKTDLQQILVFKNETHRFIHIGVYNMFDKEGRPNYSAKLESFYRDANRAKDKALFEKSIGAENAFGSSFFVRLMNTPLEQWETAVEIGNLDLYTAQDFAFELTEQYEAEGYTITGSRGAKAIRHTGNGKHINNVIIKNATMKRIFEIVEKLTEGMTGVNIMKIKKDIYNKYTDPKISGFDTRRKFWHHIMRNWDNYAA